MRKLLVAAILLLYAIALLAALSIPEVPYAEPDGTTLRYEPDGN